MVTEGTINVVNDALRHLKSSMEQTESKTFCVIDNEILYMRMQKI